MDGMARPEQSYPECCRVFKYTNNGWNFQVSVWVNVTVKIKYDVADKRQAVFHYMANIKRGTDFARSSSCMEYCVWISTPAGQNVTSMRLLSYCTA